MDGTIGEVRMFAGNFAPRAWAFCEGQLIAISQNTALFSILGTTYGGDGRTSFALPDLRGRVPISPGTGPGLSTRKLGQRSGLETNTMNVLQMPSHNHYVNTSNATTITQVSIPAADSGADSNNPEDAYLAETTNGKTYITGTPNTTLKTFNSPGVIQGNLTTLATGANQPINNMQPFLGLNYIICMQGIFPSRS